MHKMERWRGVLGAALASKPDSPFTIAASLCLSPSGKTLAVPAANAVFFYGDRVADGKGADVVEEMSDGRNVVDLLVSKLGRSVNGWVVEASSYNGPFAVYEDFVPSVDRLGNPRGYDPHGFPAAAAVVELLSDCVEQVRSVISREQHVPIPSDDHSATSASLLPPKTIIIGFSKGGIILNQIVTEFANLKAEPRKESKEFLSETRKHIFPGSIDVFLRSIVQLHYLDVGLNTAGAYLTNHEIIKQFVDSIHVESPGLRVVLHGTPRQWCDRDRPWIGKEKDRMMQILENEVPRSNGKLQVSEKLYFSNMAPSLQMHFEVIKKFVMS